MGTIASQITSLATVYSTVYSDADQRKHQSSASLAFVRGIHRGPVNSPHKWPVTRKMIPFDDVIMKYVTPLQSNGVHAIFSRFVESMWTCVEVFSDTTSSRFYSTHWGRDKMTIIVLTTISNAFSGMKLCKLRLRFHSCFFLKGPINNISALFHKIMIYAFQEKILINFLFRPQFGVEKCIIWI